MGTGKNQRGGGKRRGEKQKNRDRDREESESETREKGGAWNQKEWWVVELVTSAQALVSSPSRRRANETRPDASLSGRFLNEKRRAIVQSRQHYGAVLYANWPRSIPASPSLQRIPVWNATTNARSSGCLVRSSANTSGSLSLFHTTRLE